MGVVTVSDVWKAQMFGACSNLPRIGTPVSELDFFDAIWAEDNDVEVDLWTHCKSGSGYGSGSGKGLRLVEERGQE